MPFPSDTNPDKEVFDLLEVERIRQTTDYVMVRDAEALRLLSE